MLPLFEIAKQLIDFVGKLLGARADLEKLGHDKRDRISRFLEELGTVVDAMSKFDPQDQEKYAGAFEIQLRGLMKVANSLKDAVPHFDHVVEALTDVETAHLLMRHAPAPWRPDLSEARDLMQRAAGMLSGAALTLRTL